MVQLFSYPWISSVSAIHIPCASGANLVREIYSIVGSNTDLVPLIYENRSSIAEIASESIPFSDLFGKRHAYITTIDAKQNNGHQLSAVTFDKCGVNPSIPNSR